jgi:hypothetical protein
MLPSGLEAAGPALCVSSRQRAACSVTCICMERIHRAQGKFSCCEQRVKILHDKWCPSLSASQFCHVRNSDSPAHTSCDALSLVMGILSEPAVEPRRPL